jgi:iron complex transport system ATP-binding protein
MTPALETRGFSLSIGAKPVVEGLGLRLMPGQVLALLGKNGVGKSTLLMALSGLSLPGAASASGMLQLFGKPYAAWPRREAARRRAWLGQQLPQAEGDVQEAALSGRLPWLSRWGKAGARDLALAEAALAETGLLAEKGRPLADLSGGQRQRAWLAALLAQGAPLMLADEPVAHLDIHHQVMLLECFRRRAQAGAALVLALHEPALALRFADSALLLFGEGESLLGPACEVLTAENLGRLYGHPMQKLGEGRRAAFIAG